MVRIATIISAVALLPFWNLISTATVAAPALEPKIFNAPVQAGAGDIVSIQGANLDAATEAYLGAPGTRTAPLAIVNRVPGMQVSVQLPTSLPSPLVLHLENKAGSSVGIKINAALPRHLDATHLVPGGRFRVFGLNLKVAGSTPSIKIAGRPATIDLNASTGIMLAATAPTDIAPTSNAEILVDNGNGSGASRLELAVPVRSGRGDPLGLGVGWAAGFDFSTRVSQAHPVCDGRADDTWAIESVIISVQQAGGGVVQLPAGTCRIASTVNLASRVILRGAGQAATTLLYAGNYPIYAENFDLVGLQDLALVNAGPVQEGMIWRGNTRSYIRRVTLNMGVSRQWFLTSNTDFVFEFNSVIQTGSYNDQNPYRFDHAAGLVFRNNRTLNTNGSPTFQFVHDAAFLNNEFSRNAITQNESHIVVHHSFVADFSYRVALVGNLFNVVNGPVSNQNRNDGETFLIEGGGGFRTENIGTVQSAGDQTLTDPGNTINIDPFGTGLPENYGVAIVSGPGAGQTRRVVKYSGKTLTVDRPWEVVPAAGSHYSTFVWGLKDAVLANNTLIGNPRGIWLYQSSVTNVDILDNKISQGGGIFLRAYQNVAQKMFTVQYNINISGNAIANTTRLWMSHIVLASVSSDVEPYGVAQIGIAVRRNTITANVPNVVSSKEDYASQEGFVALMHIEPAGGHTGPTPTILGTVFQNDTCQNCDHPFVIGTGTVGSALVDNNPTMKQPNALSDLMLLGSRYGASSATFKR